MSLLRKGCFIFHQSHLRKWNCLSTLLVYESYVRAALQQAYKYKLRSDSILLSDTRYVFFSRTVPQQALHVRLCGFCRQLTVSKSTGSSPATKNCEANIKAVADAAKHERRLRSFFLLNLLIFCSFHNSHRFLCNPFSSSIAAPALGGALHPVSTPAD